MRDEGLFFPGETCTSLRVRGLRPGAWYFTNRPPAGEPLIAADLLGGPDSAALPDVTHRQPEGTYMTHNGVAVIVPHLEPAETGVESVVGGLWKGTITMTWPATARGRIEGTLHQEGQVVDATAFSYGWPPGISGTVGHATGRVSGNRVELTMTDLSTLQRCRFDMTATLRGNTMSGSWSSACAGTRGNFTITRLRD